MPKFIVDLWLDGYDNEADMRKACEEFIYEQLNMTASSVKITSMDCPHNCTDGRIITDRSIPESGPYDGLKDDPRCPVHGGRKGCTCYLMKWEERPCEICKEINKS